MIFLNPAQPLQASNAFPAYPYAFAAFGRILLSKCCKKALSTKSLILYYITIYNKKFQVFLRTFFITGIYFGVIYNLMQNSSLIFYQLIFWQLHCQRAKTPANYGDRRRIFCDHAKSDIHGIFI